MPRLHRSLGVTWGLLYHALLPNLGLPDAGVFQRVVYLRFLDHLTLEFSALVMTAG